VIESRLLITGSVTVGVVIGVCLVLRLLLRAICTVPVALGWNPESHDKITCYALETLKHEDRPTLLGWVIQQDEGRQGSASGVFHRHAFLQLRRGVIDEDMNSDILVALQPTWERLERIFRADEELPGGAGVSALDRRLLQGADPDAYWSEWIARGLTKPLTRLFAVDVEGTNGGYHYHNPFSRNEVKGLSDPVEIALHLKTAHDIQLMRGISRPMPSATSRAFEESTPPGWWMDREIRNYTLNDATRYYALGYTHMAFYAAGRVAHLLHDMAVPAHVRDDAHFGMRGSPADPLEYFAAQEDWKAHFGESWFDPSGYPHGTFIRWKFDAERVWDPTIQRHHLEDARRQYETGKQPFLEPESLSFERFFDSLSRETHTRHYSQGTIPGNADSHNPNNTDERLPWVSDSPPDFTKCKPSIGALFEVFDILHVLAERVIGQAQNMESLAELANMSREQIAGSPAQLPSHRPIHTAWLKQHMTHQEHCQQIATIVRGFRQGSQPNVSEILDHLGEVDRLLAEMKGVPLPANMVRSTPDLTSGVLDGGYYTGGVLTEDDARRFADRKEGIGDTIDSYRQRYNCLAPTLLSQSLMDRSLSLPEALEQWISQHPNRRQLAQAFRGTHGPCCLINDREAFKGESEDNLALIRRQYDACESSAIAHTALFLARWFEALYSASPHLGITLWPNEDAPDARALPRLEATRAEIRNEEEVMLSEPLFTLGIGNNLPGEIDLDVSLLPLEPAAVDDSYAFAQEVFEDGIPIEATVDHVEGGRHSLRESIKASISITDPRSAVIPVPGLQPHTGPALDGLQLPSRGGMLREQEEERLKPIPHHPAQAEDPSAVAAAVIRIAFGSEEEGPLAISEAREAADPLEGAEPQSTRDEPPDIYGIPLKR